MKNVTDGHLRTYVHGLPTVSSKNACWQERIKEKWPKHMPYITLLKHEKAKAVMNKGCRIDYQSHIENAGSEN